MSYLVYIQLNYLKLCLYYKNIFFIKKLFFLKKLSVNFFKIKYLAGQEFYIYWNEVLFQTKYASYSFNILNLETYSYYFLTKIRLHFMRREQLFLSQKNLSWYIQSIFLRYLYYNPLQLWNILILLHFTTTKNESFLFIKKYNIFINKKIQKNPFYIISFFDIIEFENTIKNHKLYKKTIEHFKNFKVESNMTDLDLWDSTQFWYVPYNHLYTFEFNWLSFQIFVLPPLDNVDNSIFWLLYNQTSEQYLNWKFLF